MRLHGYCENCHRVRLLARVDAYTDGNIPLGQCAECIDKITRRRDEAGELVIFVPRSGSSLRIAKGSAIVGRDTGTDELTVYYEGGIYNPQMSYDEKLLHAADRLVVRYPTVARTITPRAELVPVGTYDYGSFTAEITDEAALAAWRAA